MGRKVNIIGVGMTRFAKLGASAEYFDMAAQASRVAMKDARVALQHNLGLGGACVVMMYQKSSI